MGGPGWSRPAGGRTEAEGKAAPKSLSCTRGPASHKPEPDAEVRLSVSWVLVMVPLKRIP